MGRLVGLALIASGIGAAAFVLPLSDMAAHFKASGTYQATQATAPATPSPAAPPSNAVRLQPITPHATQALLTATVPTPVPAPKPGQRGPDFSGPSTPLAKVVEVAAPPPGAPSPAPAGPAAQEPKAARLAPIAPPTIRPIENARPHNARQEPEGRGRLARDIQIELKRVGCLDSEATGEWTQATQRAMKSFIDRVNAKLPVTEPDYILLTLLQGQQTRICGATCPSGQSLSGDGRCVPSAVLAQAQRRPVQQVQRTAPTKIETASLPPAAAPSAPALGAAVQPGARPAAVSSSPPAFPQAVPTDNGTIRAAAPPLPGRMAIGGPPTPPPALPATALSSAPATALVVPSPQPVPRTGIGSATSAPQHAPPSQESPARVASLKPTGPAGPPATPLAGSDPSMAALPPGAAATAPGASLTATAPAKPNRPARQVQRPSPPRGMVSGYPPPRVQPPPRQNWARNFFRQSDISGR